jgi:hypothetical protein
MQPNKENNVQMYTNFESLFHKMTDKADRIYNAVFLLTKYVSHKNMTDRLQYLGVDFLEMSYMLHPREYEHHDHVTSELTYVLKELKALTGGIVILGIFSPESKQLFDREIDLFIETIQNYARSYADYYKKENGIVSPIFDEGFFGGKIDFLGLSTSPSQDRIGGDSIQKSPTQQSHSNQYLLEKHTLSNKKENTTPAHKMTDRKNLSDNSIRHSTENSIGQKNVIKKENRKEKIISFIKSKDQARLSDILNHIGDCSEKTIQRELNDLIDGGYLRKQGERRWSTYFFLKDIE